MTGITAQNEPKTKVQSVIVSRNMVQQSLLQKTKLHCIRTDVLRIGILAHEASKSRNKNDKNDGLYHSRTFNHKANIEYMFHRPMDSSVPIICYVNLKSRNKKKSVQLYSRGEKYTRDFIRG